MLAKKKKSGKCDAAKDEGTLEIVDFDKIVIITTIVVDDWSKININNNNNIYLTSNTNR